MSDHYKIPEDRKIREKRLDLFDLHENEIKKLKESGKINFNDYDKLMRTITDAREEYEKLHYEHLFGRKYPQLYTPTFLKQNLDRHLNEIAVQKGWRKGQLNMFKNDESHAVIMIDLDNFKKVNDTFGHVIGDIVLNKVNSIVKDVADKHKGMAAKYGGEEFQLWFPNSDREKTRKISEELIEKIRKEMKEPPSKEISKKWKGLTASAGFATHDMLANRNERLTAEGLTQLADIGLLKAKAKGKNRVISAEDS